MVSRASGGEQSPARDDEEKETKNASRLFATGSGRASFELRVGGAARPTPLQQTVRPDPQPTPVESSPPALLLGAESEFRGGTLRDPRSHRSPPPPALLRLR